VQYMNKVSLAYMAITGEPYCKSAWNGFLLNLKHLGKFYYAQLLGRYFMMIGFLVISAINSTVFFILIYRSSLKNVPVIMTTNLIMTLFITRLFLGMFDDGVLGMLMSVGVDTDIHRGECQHGAPGYHRGLEKIFHAEKSAGIHGY
jgi:drug/metabolite transporter (DMT)-like permease